MFEERSPFHSTHKSQYRIARGSSLTVRPEHFARLCPSSASQNNSALRAAAQRVDWLTCLSTSDAAWEGEDAGPPAWIRSAAPSVRFLLEEWDEMKCWTSSVLVAKKPERMHIRRHSGICLHGRIIVGNIEARKQSATTTTHLDRVIKSAILLVAPSNLPRASLTTGVYQASPREATRSTKVHSSLHSTSPFFHNPSRRVLPRRVGMSKNVSVRTNHRR